MEINLRDRDQVLQIIKEINYDQNIDRKRHNYDAWQIYNGNLDHYVEERLKEIFPKTYKWLRRSAISLTKKVVSKKSKSYREAPIRRLDRESDNMLYSEIARNGNLNSRMQAFDATYNLQKYAAIWVNPIDLDNNLFNFKVMHPFEFDRIVNPKTLETEVVVVSVPETDVRKIIDGDYRLTIIQDENEDAQKLDYYAFWTKNEHVLVAKNKEGKVEYLPIDENPDGVNPLGMLPFVFLQMGPDTSVPVKSNLINMDIEANSLRSLLLSGCDLQTFGILAISHPESQKVPDLFEQGLFVQTKLPQVTGDSPTTAEYINSSPQIMEFKEVIEDFETKIMEEEGIKSAKGSKTSEEAGVSKYMDLRDEHEIVEANQVKYRKVENIIFQIVKAYYEAANRSVFVSDSLNILYPKMKPIKDEMTLLNEIKLKKELGVIEEWEKHVILDPNLTEEEAKDKEERIQAEKSERVGELMGGLNFDGEENR